MADSNTAGQTDYSSLGQELLKQNLQNQQANPNGGIGSILQQMFGSYLQSSMANPNNPWALQSLFGGGQSGGSDYTGPSPYTGASMGG